MLCIHEGGRNHTVVPRRTNHSRPMGDGTKLSVPVGTARTNYPDGRRWRFEPGHCPHSPDFSTHRATLAATLFWPCGFRDWEKTPLVPAAFHASPIAR